LCLQISSAFATYDLVDIYNAALLNDISTQVSKEVQLSQNEQIATSRANLMPQVAGNASAHYVNNKSGQPYNHHDANIKITQPILNVGSWQQYQQAKMSVKASIALYEAAQQDLILRVATVYFNILKAEDDLNFAQAQTKSFSRLLKQTEQRFKVGLIAITDVQEAKARKDSARAQEIDFDNILQNQKEQLREIVQTKVHLIQNLTNKFDLKKPYPEDIEAWVKTALAQNLSLDVQKYQVKVAKNNINIARSGHLPTVGATAAIGQEKSLITEDSHAYKSVGIHLNVPIFTGGNTIASTRQAQHAYYAEKNKLNELERSIASKTRQHYRGILTLIGQITALEQTLASSKGALKATKSSFELGKRTIVDVLNSESNLLDTKRNLSKAKYNYLLEGFKLKRVAGTLSVKDIITVNEILKTK